MDVTKVNYLFYGVKIADIIFVVILYFVSGYYLSMINNNFIDALFGTNYNSLTTGELLFEMVFQISTNFILCRVVKKMINNVPFPLEGLGGFTHYKLKEFTYGGGLLWSVGLLFYQKSFVKKFKIFKNKNNV